MVTPPICSRIRHPDQGSRLSIGSNYIITISQLSDIASPYCKKSEKSNKKWSVAGWRWSVGGGQLAMPRRKKTSLQPVLPRVGTISGKKRSECRPVPEDTIRSIFISPIRPVSPIFQVCCTHCVKQIRWLPAGFKQAHGSEAFSGSVAQLTAFVCHARSRSVKQKPSVSGRL